MKMRNLHHYIQDYMGNNRMVVNRDDTIEQITHYYPYGPRSHRESIFMLSARRRGFSRGQVIGDISTNESLQKFKFEGKELDRTFGLDSYDIEARQYFAMAPMWDRPDQLAHKYYGISPYVYCGGDPVNRGDYDGEELFFINGFTTKPREMGDESYWAPHIVKRFQKLEGAGSSNFIDGSTGGIYTIPFAGTFFPWIREAYGYLQTRGKEKEIIDKLRDNDGKIVEPLIVISHSMGAAYAKGFLRRIMEYVKKHETECDGFSAIEYDFAPYQSIFQSPVDNVETYIFDHRDDWLAGHNGMPNAHRQNTLADAEQTHSNGSFYDSIINLPQGRYRLVNGEWIKE